MRDEAWDELKRLEDAADVVDAAAAELVTGLDKDDLAVPLPMMAVVMVRAVALATLTVASRLEALTFVLREGFDSIEEKLGGDG